MKSCIILLMLSTLMLPVTGRGEESNDTSSLFGITVTNTLSEADKQFDLGYAYLTGDGVETNISKAVECYQKAAELGHAKAQFNLGLCYMNGTGVEQSDKNASSWLKKAAAQNVMEALYPLGICFYNLEDYTEAYAWALAAEASGDTRLKEMLDPIYTEEEIAAGRARFEASREKHHAENQEKAAARPEER